MEVSASSATLSTMKRKNDAYLSTERFGRLFSFLTPYKRCWVLFQLTSPGLTQNTWLFPKKNHHKCQHTHTLMQTKKSLKFSNPKLVFMPLMSSLPSRSECDPFEVLTNFTAPLSHILSLITGPKMICIASHSEI